MTEFMWHFTVVRLANWCGKVAIVLDMVSPYCPPDSLHFLLVRSFRGNNAEVGDLLVLVFELVLYEEDCMCASWYTGSTSLCQPSDFHDVCPIPLLSLASLE